MSDLGGVLYVGLDLDSFAKNNRQVCLRLQGDSWQEPSTRFAANCLHTESRSRNDSRVACLCFVSSALFATSTFLSVITFSLFCSIGKKQLFWETIQPIGCLSWQQENWIKKVRTKQKPTDLPFHSSFHSLLVSFDKDSECNLVCAKKYLHIFSQQKTFCNPCWVFFWILATQKKTFVKI